MDCCLSRRLAFGFAVLSTACHSPQRLAVAGSPLATSESPPALGAPSPHPHSSSTAEDPPAEPNPAAFREHETTTYQDVVVELRDGPPALLRRPASNGPHPLVVVAHGAGGSAEWAADWIQSLLQVPAFLLCVRGRSMSHGIEAYYYPDHLQLGRWLSDSVAEVRRNYATELSHRVLYVAYSQGATMGALAIQSDNPSFTDLLLVEGGLEGWTLARSREFARSGGRSVYFACGTKTCAERARTAVKHLSSVGLDARLGYAAGAGHTPDAGVATLVDAALEGLLAL